MLWGLQGAALGAMVGQLTFGKRQFEELDSTMRALIPRLHKACEEMTAMIDADTNAFNDYMVIMSDLIKNTTAGRSSKNTLSFLSPQAALKMPQGTPEESLARSRAMQEGLKAAVAVPFGLATAVNRLWPSMAKMALHGNMNCKSDIQVGW